MANIDASVKAAYEDIRKPDNSDTWVILKYVGNKITVQQTGSGIENFVEQLSDKEIQYGYLRLNIQTEEGMRTKFVLISWTGEDVSPLKRGKAYVDKSNLKSIIQDFAIDLATSNKEELCEDYIIRKAVASNY